MVPDPLVFDSPKHYEFGQSGDLKNEIEYKLKNNKYDSFDKNEDCLQQ